MKDTIIKGDGTSRVLKAPASMPETYEEWRAQLMNGSATMDIGLNKAGCEVVGTALDKKTLLTDETAVAIGANLDDPTVDEALRTLGQRDMSAIVKVYAPVGSVVTATLGSTVVTSTVEDTGIALLRLYSLGDWLVHIEASGSSVDLPVVVDTVAVYSVSASLELEDCSWSFINSVVEAGLAEQSWEVGDKKTILVDGASYEVCIIGFNHDTKTAGGKAGITFQMVDCLNTLYPMHGTGTNSKGWEGCAMRTTLSSIFNQLSPELQKVIKAVDKQTSAGGESATIKTTSDNLFLLSVFEILGTTGNSKSGEGSHYSYYAAGNTVKKKVNGVADRWWTRSPNGNSNAAYMCIGELGGSGSSNANTQQGVSFAFCI